MPRESRHIKFDCFETYHAIYALCTQKQQKKPPPGAIIDITEDNRVERTFIFQIENIQDGTSAKLEYTRDFVAAALMLYCKRVNIPLPREADKRIDVYDNGFMLVCEM